MARLVGTGHLDRGGTDVVRVGSRARESAGTPGPGDEPAGDDGADADRIGERAPGLLDQLSDGFGAGFKPGVQGSDLGDEIGDDGFADSLDLATGADRTQQRGGCCRGQIGGCAASEQYPQQRVQLVTARTLA